MLEFFRISMVAESGREMRSINYSMEKLKDTPTGTVPAAKTNVSDIFQSQLSKSMSTVRSPGPPGGKPPNTRQDSVPVTREARVTPNAKTQQPDSSRSKADAKPSLALKATASKSNSTPIVQKSFDSLSYRTVSAPQSPSQSSRSGEGIEEDLDTKYATPATQADVDREQEPSALSQKSDAVSTTLQGRHSSESSRKVSTREIPTLGNALQPVSAQALTSLHVGNQPLQLPEFFAQAPQVVPVSAELSVGSGDETLEESDSAPVGRGLSVDIGEIRSSEISVIPLNGDEQNPLVERAIGNDLMALRSTAASNVQPNSILATVPGGLQADGPSRNSEVAPTTASTPQPVFDHSTESKSSISTPPNLNEQSAKKNIGERILSDGANASTQVTTISNENAGSPLPNGSSEVQAAVGDTDGLLLTTEMPSINLTFRSSGSNLIPTADTVGADIANRWVHAAVNSSPQRLSSNVTSELPAGSQSASTDSNLAPSASNPNTPLAQQDDDLQSSSSGQKAAELKAGEKPRSVAASPGKSQASAMAETPNSGPTTGTISHLSLQGTSARSAQNVTLATSTPKNGLNEQAQVLNIPDRAAAAKQVSDQLRLLAASRSQKEVVVQLNPKELGAITVAVKSVGTLVNATILASNEPVREALDHGRADLAQTMLSHGYQTHTITVGTNQTNESLTSNEGTEERRSPRQHPNQSFSRPSGGAEKQASASQLTRSPASIGVDVWI